MLDEETLRILEVIGVWVASIGTVAAVIVSLWLARRDGTIRLQISVSPVLHVGSVTGAMTEYVEIKVLNVGLRKAQVNGIGWHSGLLRRGPCPRKRYLQLPGKPPSSTLPVELSDGQTAVFLLPKHLDRGVSWYSDFLPGVADTWLRRRTLRILAWTSAGKVFSARPSPAFMDEVKTAAQQ